MKADHLYTLTFGLQVPLQPPTKHTTSSIPPPLKTRVQDISLITQPAWRTETTATALTKIFTIGAPATGKTTFDFNASL